MHCNDYDVAYCRKCILSFHWPSSESGSYQNQIWTAEEGGEGEEREKRGGKSEEGGRRWEGRQMEKETCNNIYSLARVCSTCKSFPPSGTIFTSSFSGPSCAIAATFLMTSSRSLMYTPHWARTDSRSGKLCWVIKKQPYNYTSKPTSVEVRTYSCISWLAAQESNSFTWAWLYRTCEFVSRSIFQVGVYLHTCAVTGRRAPRRGIASRAAAKYPPNIPVFDLPIWTKCTCRWSAQPSCISKDPNGQWSTGAAWR